MEAERQAKKKLEKDYKKVLELMEEERERKKHIVLLLLAERKKIITKYIEESKRSEDLAQILTEEKGRVDTMAEGLEEESKKSLHFEAELEKHLAQCDTEQQKLKAALSKEEKRVKELESELDKTKEEVESLKKQLLEAHQFIMLEAGQQRGTIQRPSSASGTPPPPPAKPNLLACHTSPRPTQPSTPAKGSAWAQSGIPHMDGSVSPPPTGTPMMSSVAKVVQPTATVSSVPVCGPTTGIARSVSPGQGIRNVAYSVASSPDSRTAAITRDPTSWPQQQTTQESQPVPVPPEKPVTTRIVPNADRSQPQVHQVTSRVCVSAPPRTKVIKSSQGGTLTVLVTQNSESGGVGTPIPPNIPQGTTTASVTSPAPVIPSPVSASSPQGVAVTPPKKVAPLGRGAPPPVPPNKPVVPPKKEAFPRAITPLAASAASVASIPDSSQSSNMVDAKKPVPSGGLKFGKGIPKDKNRVTDRSPQQGVEAGGGGGGDASSHHHPDAGGGGRAGRREPQVGECGCNRDICHCGTCPAPSLDETQPATAHLVPPNPATHSCSQTADAAPLNGGVLAHSEVARPALHEAPDLDMLGQELADFQDLLSSMVSGKNRIISLCFSCS
ncbi:hypothetical protein J437_LFUL014187 [Ladona fulva]|uniref:Cortactin-binding protein-2 N-terminal domain-containing protein n=1 Tax=Ladona fulva TaxID=123851 RepID=A0A8K0P5E9_LADFU|nr:hypothetical protein J437_LFUL014187 [Ladona fulva]